MTEISSRLSTALADRYKIESRLGEGGMATVYLAEDLKHKRKVAVKVLRPELAAVLGAERFVQEITTTANLQHPNILPLFDSGEADSFLYYVMPFIDGETLRDKLNRETQLGIEEAVSITTDIADALDYAHRQGVIHRDIKPENILLHDGRPMVADFGIALAVSAAAGGRMTETGLSLGTPHYMSPEQATAEKELTARSDVYSLGCVLYEMLTGEPPHTGASAQAIVMKIVTDEARPVTELRKSVPPHVAAATAQALEKLAADRFQSAAQFGVALTTPAFSRAVPAQTVSAVLDVRTLQRWRRAAFAAGIVALVSLAGLLGVLQRATPPRLPVRFTVKLPEDQSLMYWGASPPRISLSPDGRTLVYAGIDGIPSQRLTGGPRSLGISVLRGRGGGTPPEGWLLFARPLGELRARALPGTEEGIAPAVSPDGRQVAYLGLATQRPSIWVTPLTGGPSRSLADTGVGSNPSWGPDGYVYFLDDPGLTVKRVRASGGSVEEVVAFPRLADGRFYRAISVLPTARGIVATEFSSFQSDVGSGSVHIIDLASGEIAAKVPGYFGTYVSSGHLVYVANDQTMMAVPFDERSLEMTGEPVAILAGVELRIGGFTDVTVGGDGTLAYTTENLNAPEEPVWVSLDGDVRPVDPGWTDFELEGVALSPSGDRMAVVIRDDAGRVDIRMKVLDEGPISRLTFDGDFNIEPRWSNDGRWISFLSRRGESVGVWRKRSDGVGIAEQVIELEVDVAEHRWSRDGEWLVVTLSGVEGFGIHAMRVGEDTVPLPLVDDTRINEVHPALSPDGRWLAYVSDASGRREVYVRPFPAVDDGMWLVSSDGGEEPLWSPDAAALYFRSLDGGVIHVVDMQGGPSVAAPGPSIILPANSAFEQNDAERLYDITPDGKRFVMIRQGAGDASGDLVVVLNFFAELKAKVGN